MRAEDAVVEHAELGRLLVNGPADHRRLLGIGEVDRDVGGLSLRDIEDRSRVFGIDEQHIARVERDRRIEDADQGERRRIFARRGKRDHVTLADVQEIREALADDRGAPFPGPGVTPAGEDAADRPRSTVSERASDHGDVGPELRQENVAPHARLGSSHARKTGDERDRRRIDEPWSTAGEVLHDDVGLSAARPLGLTSERARGKEHPGEQRDRGRETSQESQGSTRAPSERAPRECQECELRTRGHFSTACPVGRSGRCWDVGPALAA